MKTIFYSLLILLIPLMSTAQEIDWRVDNISYWKRMIEQGFVEPNPEIEVPPAIPKSSVIESPIMSFQNSTDVLVDPSTTDHESENSIHVNPYDEDHALNSNNAIRVSGGSITSLGVSEFNSFDQGQNWNGSINGPSSNARADPAAIIGNDGREFIGYIDANDGQGISFSDNNGTSWTDVTIASTSPGLLDKNHLWIDNCLWSPNEGNLYSAWTPLGTGGSNDGEIEISRSTNNGSTWSTPTIISTGVSAGNHNQGVNIKTGPEGNVYAVWAVYDNFPDDEEAIGFSRSTDGGVTWSTATRIIDNIKGIRDTRTSKNMRVNSFPTMAVDVSGGPNDGNIYVVWSNFGVPQTNTGSNIEIWMIRSTDEGNSWSSPIRVNQDSPTDNESYFPWIAADPITGALFVVFYDDRNVASTDAETFVAISSDAGNNWDDFRISDVSFTPSPIPGIAGDYFGDYLGITVRDGIVYPCWTDNRNGNAQTFVSPFIFGCIEDLALQDVLVDNGQLVDQNAELTVTLAGSSTTYDVESGADVTFEGGTSVTMLPGFTAENGSDFRAGIQSCVYGTQKRNMSEGKTDENNAISENMISEEFEPIEPSKEVFNFMASPNPHNGKFNVVQNASMSKSQNAKQIWVTDLMGRVIFQTAPSQNLASSYEVDINQFPKGFYLVKMKVGELTLSKKVLYR